VANGTTLNAVGSNQLAREFNIAADTIDSMNIEIVMARKTLALTKTVRMVRGTQLNVREIFEIIKLRGAVDTAACGHKHCHQSCTKFCV
jgi:hypothetical protein